MENVVKKCPRCRMPDTDRILSLNGCTYKDGVLISPMTRLQITDLY